MKRPALPLAVLLLGSMSAAASAPASKPEFQPLLIPAGKSASDLKPAPQARADEPIVLELRAHRHADGSLHFECDHAQRDGADATHAEDAQ